MTGGAEPAVTIRERRESALDIAAVRAGFPALNQLIGGKPLVYLDSAASALKPQAVLDEMMRFYQRDYSNIHRAVHALAQRSTAAYERARAIVQRFLNAAAEGEVIFVRGTTEALNLVAQSFGRPRLAAGDEILITGLEHHSNIVPWQLLCHQTGARLVVAPINPAGDVSLAAIATRLSNRTRIVACSHVSNALGTVLPVAEITALARNVGAVSVIDGAQAVPHLPVDVQALGCDFYAFSGHKIYGPSGIGVLWGRRALLEEMAPWQGGGDMIRSVAFEQTLYADPPQRFEAGTPHIAGAVGLAAALEFVSSLGWDALVDHEHQLFAYGVEALTAIPGLRLIGTAPKRIAVLSFVLDGVHPHDVGTILDGEGVAVRTGHHCAQPVHDAFDVPATVRASLGMYNQRSDIDALVQGLARVREFFPLRGSHE
jgi:cysteine desulfurase/selenocysteine lyase